MIFERETIESDDDKLADRFTESREQRRRRVAAKRIDPETAAAIRRALGE